MVTLVPGSGNSPVSRNTLRAALTTSWLATGFAVVLVTWTSAATKARARLGIKTGNTSDHGKGNQDC